MARSKEEKEYQAKLKIMKKEGIKYALAQRYIQKRLPDAYTEMQGLFPKENTEEFQKILKMALRHYRSRLGIALGITIVGIIGVAGNPEVILFTFPAWILVTKIIISGLTAIVSGICSYNYLKIFNTGRGISD